MAVCLWLSAFMVLNATCAYAGEHWVCSIPHKLEPTRTVILDYEVRGDKLLMTHGVEYQIIRNDDRILVAIDASDFPVPDQVAQVVGIDKQRGLFKYMDLYFGEGDIPSMGDCQRRTDAPQ
jgi:hypothetical protein